MIVKKDKHTSWEKEFYAFVNSDPVSPPVRLTEKLEITVSHDLEPAIWNIFTKFAGVQAACATITLFFCPQFEIGFAKRDPFSGLVQQLGEFGLLIVCGMIFLGSGALMAPLFFRQAEVKALGRSVLIYFPTVALLALMLFYLFGANINLTLALPWLFGASLGGLIGFELVKYLKKTVICSYRHS